MVGELGTSARPEVTAAPTVQAAVLLSPRLGIRFANWRIVTFDGR